MVKATFEQRFRMPVFQLLFEEVIQMIASSTLSSSDERVRQVKHICLNCTDTPWHLAEKFPMIV